jgi:hypothetical protein
MNVKGPKSDFGYLREEKILLTLLGLELRLLSHPVRNVDFFKQIKIFYKTCRKVDWIWTANNKGSSNMTMDQNIYMQGARRH